MQFYIVCFERLSIALLTELQEMEKNTNKTTAKESNSHWISKKLGTNSALRGAHTTSTDFTGSQTCEFNGKFRPLLDF